jgi:hypothetical protein
MCRPSESHFPYLYAHGVCHFNHTDLDAVHWHAHEDVTKGHPDVNTLPFQGAPKVMDARQKIHWLRRPVPRVPERTAHPSFPPRAASLKPNSRSGSNHGGPSRWSPVIDPHGCARNHGYIRQHIRQSDPIWRQRGPFIVSSNVGG